jgi:hypothetical protein
MRELLMKQPGLHDQIDGCSTPGDGVDAQVADLAACLFALRAAQEADLRALTWIQTSLEGVRAGRATGDTDLLLGEMARLLAEAQAAETAVVTQRDAAAELLAHLIAERRARTVLKPVATFAA